MSIIEKAVEKLTNDPIEQNKIVQQKEPEGTSKVFGAVVAEADRVSGHRFSDKEQSKDVASSNASSKKVELDLKHMDRAQITLDDEGDPCLNEELRMIKRKLLVNASGLGDSIVEKGNLIMVTSSVANEGKTFIATNLALSIAREIDQRVLLVDADISKSDVSKAFGINEERGLTDYLKGEAQLHELLLRTDIDGLTVLPTGKKVNNAAELMSSKKMASLFSELSRRYKDRIIIFDCPPILVTSEAPIIASLVGQIAFVIRAGETQEKEFVNAIERLDHSKFVGLILNHSNEEAEIGYYGSYHNSK